MIVLERDAALLEQGTNMLVTGVTQALHADLKHEPETRPRAAGQERDGFQPPSSGVSYQRGRRPHPNPQSDKRDDCLKPNPHLVWLVLPRWRTLWTVKRLAGKPPGRPLHSGRFVSDGRPPARAAGFPGCGHGTRALALAPPAPAWAHGARLSFEIYMQDSQESIENARQVCRARSAANLLTVRDTGTRRTRGLGLPGGGTTRALRPSGGQAGKPGHPPKHRLSVGQADRLSDGEHRGRSRLRLWAPRLAAASSCPRNGLPTRRPEARTHTTTEGYTRGKLQAICWDTPWGDRSQKGNVNKCLLGP